MNNVLFVCVENACRSQLAESITNAKFGDYLIAFSAGSNPAKEINPKAIKSFKYLMLGIFIYYIGWVLFAEKEKCTRVTYQDFDSNGNIVTKKGQVCGDARHKINDRWKDD
mgnify:CR=1 FL=1